MAQEEDTVWVLEVIGLWACGTREALNKGLAQALQ